jgi:hypothetical protein
MTRPDCIHYPADTPQTTLRQRRGMTREEAAAYCGCESTAAFSDWVRRGIVPGPHPEPTGGTEKLSMRPLTERRVLRLRFSSHR